MGEVSDAIKGSGPPAPAPGLGTGNLRGQVRALRDEVGRLTAVKDEETLAEGADKRADNARKAGLLRAVASLLSAADYLLGDY